VLAPLKVRIVAVFVAARNRSNAFIENR